MWELVDPVPLAWQTTGEQKFSLTVVDDQDAVFAAGDGTDLRVTIGPHEEECFGWDDDALLQAHRTREAPPSP